MHLKVISAFLQYKMVEEGHDRMLRLSQCLI